ncbi:hypothetical protein WDL1P1_00316 (plasmid) [Variovorax sp. WDL1]|uniref:hypothetical protein n=1 Tax=Variovorax sp. WDL1 TaxID=207745 RepID=UPI000A7F0B41|nr:hypothetical protein [Variovorax sp. WDL1]PNG50269.1 hypothetical protein CHC06_05892 [Variovorax sp. B2]PNG51142.1 hypothetical protein CHC07_05798 [Variovorax sp. B4]VTU42584.1 hypothetical protein SRS16P1_00306 [Variovorax sp. SRS16]VTU42609.1 hypothetical protein E5P1_00304 [Variovorax sp. PBL-E5]VTU43912.1 hypothetical protein H6P1_00623 [Variovorax sp. PBL-H6]
MTPTCPSQATDGPAAAQRHVAPAGTPLSDALERTRVELGQQRTPAYGDALALCRCLEAELVALRDTPQPAAMQRADRTEIHKRLTRLQTGGCTCMTKTPVLAYHSESCRYRLASEVDLLLAAEEQTVPSAPVPSIEEMAALLGRLRYALRKHAGTVPFAMEVADRAGEYLRRHGLQGSPLRTGAREPGQDRA